jgi:hypothetical protein
MAASGRRFPPNQHNKTEKRIMLEVMHERMLESIVGFIPPDRSHHLTLAAAMRIIVFQFILLGFNLVEYNEC